MERTGWIIDWSVPLMPDAACVPGDEVFLASMEHHSLVAGSDGAPGLLFASHDALLECAKRCIKKRKRKEARRRKRQRDAMAPKR